MGRVGRRMGRKAPFDLAQGLRQDLRLRQVPFDLAQGLRQSLRLRPGRGLRGRRYEGEALRALVRITRGAA